MRIGAVAALLWVAACGSGGHEAPDAAPPPDAAGTAHVTLLGFNDFHGALVPEPDGAGGTIGGAAYLAGEIAALRTPNTVVVAAGDLIGGSPLESALFHDVPTIEALNAMGLDLSSVGNHEFDEGTAELHRVQDGGCHPVDGCPDGEPFAGATFQYLAANVVDTTTGTTVLPPFAIREVDGVKIAFVGMTLQNTPAETLASAIPELTFGDEVVTLDALLPTLQDAGAKVVVLLVHEGGTQSGGAGGCVDPTGPIFAIAASLDGDVAVIVSGHSHSAFSCEVGDVVVTQAGAQGRLLDEIALDIDRATGAVLDVTVTAHAITDAITPDPEVAAIVAHYETLVAPLRDEVIATITADIDRAANPGGENEVGDVVTDAMRSAAGSDVALMVAGGLRDDFVYALSGAETVDGQVTYGEAFAVQPFANLVQTGTLTGADLLAGINELLDQITLEVSGMTFAWNPGAPAGQHVVAGDVTVGGAPLDVDASYRVTVNAIIAQDMTAWASATDVTGNGVDLDLLTAYLSAQSPLSPPPLDRITLTP